jgi:hypothetical protein
VFRAIVLDVWRSKQRETERLQRDLEAHIAEKQQRLDRLDEAFVYERSIDRSTYERHRDELREQIGLAELELNDATLDRLDVDGVLAFAEHLLTNAARLWIELGLEEKQRLQRLLFPEGLRYDGERFGTAVTCLAFRKFDGSSVSQSGMASPTGRDAILRRDYFVDIAAA